MKFLILSLLLVTASANEKTLFHAIAMHESSDGNPSTPSEHGEIGKYQLRKQYVDDVNRILGHKAYTYTDRMHPTKCRNMMRVIWKHYRSDTMEKKIRRHLGGPNGMDEDFTIKYYKKVKKIYETRLLQTGSI